ncbi:family 2 glycosyl transferase [Spongiactinospora rosea]|uniref:Family 2 glycosyl transferase n=1 Tax=Spongiactinospora rosea TaxID=2248750 RepID=A0A366M6V2_9ACTN|nr:glycosyltransferase [Spongiactinospora rosea]RBQ21324.1 family 2 glycosyl transferase [Spongiactinospora rosea]
MSVAIVMPTCRDEADLAATVEDLLATMEDAEHCVIIVADDTGRDPGEGRMAEHLAARFPGRVRVAYQTPGAEHGSAVRTGVAFALERTHAERILLIDPDARFGAHRLPEIIQEAGRERADVVVGYRLRPPRTLLGRAREADCAYKLFDRHVLERHDLGVEAATLSLRLLTRSHGGDIRILRRPLEPPSRVPARRPGSTRPFTPRDPQPPAPAEPRPPRTEPPPAAPWRHHLRAALTRLGPPPSLGKAMPWRPRRPKARDRTLALVTLAAIVLSLAAWHGFAASRLAYPDAISHLLIARRVVDSPTPGLAQLGGVWLPLPHLLSLPLVWIDAWYHSGLAATLISMAAYVLATRYVYKTARDLTDCRKAGITAGAVFALCPGVLYLQSTPMTESLLLCCVAATVHHLTRWRATRSYRSLAATAIAALAATLTRYEAWALALLVMAVVAWTTWRDARPARQPRGVEANVIFYATPAFAGIALWVIWNAVIFNDPLYFYSGEFAKPSLWVAQGEAAANDWWTALLTYGYAVLGNLGPLVLLLAVPGLAAYVLRRRDPAPLLVLALVPVFVWALRTGQRPLHVEEITGDLYNVRFGLVMILPVALLAGGLAAGTTWTHATRATRWARGWAVPGVVVAACAVATAATVAHGVDARREAEAFQAGRVARGALGAASWLRANYDGGAVLMHSFGNETVMFHSHLPTRSIVYEGSFRRWAAALADPRGAGIQWIHMRRTPGNTDRVFRALHGTTALRDYTRAYIDTDRVVYRAKAGS